MERYNREGLGVMVGDIDMVMVRLIDRNGCNLMTFSCQAEREVTSTHISTEAVLMPSGTAVTKIQLKVSGGLSCSLTGWAHSGHQFAGCASAHAHTESRHPLICLRRR